MAFIAVRLGSWVTLWVAVARAKNLSRIVSKARTWYNSSEMKSVMEKSGVVGSPSIRVAARACLWRLQGPRERTFCFALQSSLVPSNINRDCSD